ncbi:solute carrier family 40 member 1 isoform X3 [Cucumis sativus]|uniref:solute carrier family 40 member 1 isoform X3 n=1 Tax=Cucumis sativus TaxID=3659 RepID=UPI0012F49055|nr:solute carrier family 40 member 1 isoform X3 [Cucumis sativus]
MSRFCPLLRLLRYLFLLLFFGVFTLDIFWPDGVLGFILLVILTNIAGAVGALSSLAGTILVEREWVVVISERHPPEVLTNINSTMRRIDLVCKLLSPVISGFIISFISLKASAMTLAVWNIISVWLEYWLFTSVYDGIPALEESSQRRVSRLALRDVGESSSVSQQIERLIPNDVDARSAERSWKVKMFNWFSKVPFVTAWKVYLEQDTVLPGVALALLFFTVLSFGTLMTATLEWEGIPAYIIGIARGVSATIGIAATLVYPIVQSRILTLRTGLWSIWSQPLVSIHADDGSGSVSARTLDVRFGCYPTNAGSSTRIGSMCRRRSTECSPINHGLDGIRYGSHHLEPPGLLEVDSDIVHGSDFGGVALHHPPLPHPKASVSHGEVGFLLLQMAVKFGYKFFSLLNVKNIVSFPFASKWESL